MSPLVDRGGKLVLSAEKKASLFSVQFDAKQCRDCFQQLQSYGPSLVLCYVVFWPSFIRGLLLDLNPYGGNDPDRKFLFFFTSWWLET